jgi:hypothetical protein
MNLSSHDASPVAVAVTGALPRRGHFRKWWFGHVSWIWLALYQGVIALADQVDTIKSALGALVAPQWQPWISMAGVALTVTVSILKYQMIADAAQSYFSKRIGAGQGGDDESSQ